MYVMRQFIPETGFTMWKASSPTVAPKTNDEVFELEVTPHCDALYRAAIALTMDSEDAEHLVREALLKAYRLWHQIPPVDNVLAWLLSVLSSHVRQRILQRPLCPRPHRNDRN